MDQIDPAQAQRVWQRVKSGDAASAEVRALPRLLALESEAWYTYTYLAKNTPLRDSRLLAQLRDQSQSQFHALAGLHLLTTGSRPPQNPQPNLRGNAEGLLRLCWRNRQQALALLEKAQVPPEFAFLLPLLRDRTREHCRMLLELLGCLSRQT